jgi:hypothetical protein
MNFLTLQQRLARRLNKTSSTLVTDTATRFKETLNERHRELLRRPGMLSLRWGTITVASVASQQGYALPLHGIARVNRIWDESNRIKLQYRDLGWLREIDPNPVSGRPVYWIPTGMMQVHTQPANASQVFVKSTAGGDTSQTCYVEGYITGGYRRTASVTLTGTSGVSLSAAITNFIQIDKCYLSAVPVGVVTLHEDSGSGTELSKIGIGDTYASFLSFLLYPTPSGVVTYTLDITRSIADMSNDTDEPLLPEDFHDLLLDGAELQELTKSDDPSRYAMVREQWEQGKRELMAWVQDHPDWQPVMTGGHRRTRIEQSWLISDA